MYDDDGPFVRPGDHFLAHDFNVPYDYEVGKVVSTRGSLVVWTPIYDPRHDIVFFTATREQVQRGIVELEEVAEMQRREAAAELFAETHIPQHLVW